MEILVVVIHEKVREFGLSALEFVKLPILGDCWH